MPQLAQVIADFHRGANRFLAPETSVAALLAVLKDNEAALAGETDACPADALATVNRGSREALAALALLLQARASGGYVRHCHGDLHLRNIVEIDGAPVLFDAIEFDDAIATIDVLYDLAFLLMDLGARGLRSHANAVLNAYLEASGDTGNLIGLAALAAVPLHAGDDQGQGRDVAREPGSASRERRRAAAPRPMFRLRATFLSGSGRGSSPSADCREAASRAWRRRSRLISASFRVRCMCGAMSSASGCSASAPEERLPGPLMRAEVSDTSTPCAASAP